MVFAILGLIDQLSSKRRQVAVDYSKIKHLMNIEVEYFRYES